MGRREGGNRRKILADNFKRYQEYESGNPTVLKLGVATLLRVAKLL
jgi:hypothetical protein